MVPIGGIRTRSTCPKASNIFLSSSRVIPYGKFFTRMAVSPRSFLLKASKSTPFFAKYDFDSWMAVVSAMACLYPESAEVGSNISDLETPRRCATASLTASWFMNKEFQLKADVASAFFLICFCFFNGNFAMANSSSLFSLFADAGMICSSLP